MPEHLHAIVLAAGDGERALRSTKHALALSTPKQFSIGGGNRTPLQATLARARRLIPLGRIVVVVAEEHRRFWTRELAGHPPENVIAQPFSRGTAAELLLPFLEVLHRDSEAQVLVLPTNHGVTHEEPLARAMVDATEVARRDGKVVLLGAFPGELDSEYGWIVPEGALDRCRGVSHFVENPNPGAARTLVEEGALVNTEILASDGEPLLHLYARHLPELLGELLARRSDLTDIYQRLPVRDLIRHILAPSCEALAVVPVAASRWSQTGTPGRRGPSLACGRF